jgi:hypothetical protein
VAVRRLANRLIEHRLQVLRRSKTGLEPTGRRGHLLSDAVLLDLQLVERHRTGEVGVQQLGALVFQTTELCRRLLMLPGCRCSLPAQLLGERDKRVRN